jgi:hypothetical protein
MYVQGIALPKALLRRVDRRKLWAHPATPVKQLFQPALLLRQRTRRLPNRSRVVSFSAVPAEILPEE